MKKKFSAIAAACMMLALAVVFLAGCSDNAAANNATSDTANTAKDSEKKVLVVGINAERSPYSFVNADGQYVGFDVDVATAVAKRNGWDVKLEAINWGSKEAQLNEGAISCIWSGFAMDGLEDEYAFSDPYMLDEQVIIAKKGAIVDEKALAGKTVATKEGSEALSVLEDEKGKLALRGTFKELRLSADYDDAFKQLDLGGVDAVACDLSVAKSRMSASPDRYSIVTTLSSKHYAVGFKVGEDEMAKAVTDTLKAMDRDGSIKELCKKYEEFGLTYNDWILGK